MRLLSAAMLSRKACEYICACKSGRMSFCERKSLIDNDYHFVLLSDWLISSTHSFANRLYSCEVFGSVFFVSEARCLAAIFAEESSLR